MIRFIISLPARITYLFTQVLTVLVISAILMGMGSALTLYLTQSHLNSICFVHDKTKTVNSFVDWLTFWD